MLEQVPVDLDPVLRNARHVGVDDDVSCGSMARRRNSRTLRDQRRRFLHCFFRRFRGFWLVLRRLLLLTLVRLLLRRLLGRLVRLRVGGGGCNGGVGGSDGKNAGVGDEDLLSVAGDDAHPVEL